MSTKRFLTKHGLDVFGKGIDSTGLASLFFAINGVTKAIIYNSGSVAINTTNTPQGMLQVNGDVVLGSGAGERGNKLWLYQISATNGGFISSATAGDITFNVGTTGISEAARITPNGQLLIGTTTAAGKVTWGNGTHVGLLDFTADGVALGSSTGTVSTYTAGVRRMTVDASGRVGIGTATPANLLEVSGASGSAQVTSTTTTNVAVFSLKQVGYSYFGTEGVSGGQIVTGSSAYSTVLATDQPRSLHLGTNNAVRLTVDTNGQVGIGTNAPVDNGRALTIYNSATNGTAALYVQNATSGGTTGDGVMYGLIGSNANIWNYETGSIILATANTERARLDSSGNLGVGVTGPTSRIHAVNAALTVADPVIRASNNTASTSLTPGGLRVDGAVPLRFYQGGTEAFQVDTNSNIIVGTTARTTASRVNIQDTLAISNATGAQYVLMGNQDSGGVNLPSVLRAANGALTIGVGNSWSSATGGTTTDVVQVSSSGLRVYGNLTLSDGNVLSTITPTYAFRNLIINGGFDIWQRGTSQTSVGYGSDDRWSNTHNGSTKTHSQQAFALGQTDVPGNPKFFSRTVVSSVTGASNFVAKIQRIEDVTRLSGKTLKMSFWAKADAAKNIAIEGGQYFGTGGSPSATITGVSSQLVALTTAWTKFTVNVVMPSVSGKVAGTNNDHATEIVFWFDAGSSYAARAANLGQRSGTFDIANVQIEENQFTSFEVRPPVMELTLCQRFYETGSYKLFQSSGSVVSGAVNFRQIKRGVPVMGYGSATARNFVPTSTEWAEIESFGVSRNGGTELAFIWTANAEL